MEELTPVGLSRDGDRLVLIDRQGTEYGVPVDRRLRSALQGDQARLGQLEMKMESTLRPRDIQVRIRAGESAEDVAAAAGTTVDRIMGFAGPVLAERAHVAQSAQASSVRRRNNDGGQGVRTLGEAAAARFGELGLHEDDVDWDAWRRDDGRWTLVAEYVAEDRPRRAEFSYDVPGRYVTADNEEARLLTGESRPRSRTPRGEQGRRLSAVPSQDELPLGDDALELVSDHADADWIAEEPADSTQPAPGADDAEGEHEVTVEPQGAGEQDSAPPPSEEDAGTDADHGRGEPTVEVDEAPGRRPRPPRRKGRPAVPSWDEIMFGGGGKSDGG